MDISAEIEGDKQVSRRLGIMADGVTNFREPMRDIAGELQKSFQDNFDSQGGLFQGGWPKRQNEASYDHPILDDSGHMRGGFRERVGQWSATLWNVVPYFRYHQSNKARKTALPRRIMIKVDAQRKTFIVKAIQLYIVRLRRR